LDDTDVIIMQTVKELLMEIVIYSLGEGRAQQCESHRKIIRGCTWRDSAICSQAQNRIA
jgi:hypothetical protein